MIDEIRNSLLSATIQNHWAEGELLKTGLTAVSARQRISYEVTVPRDLTKRRLYAYLGADVSNTLLDFSVRARVIGLLGRQEVFSLPIEISDGSGFTDKRAPISVFSVSGEAPDSVLLAVNQNLTQIGSHLKRLNPMNLNAAIDALRFEVLDTINVSTGNYAVRLFSYMGCLSSIA